MATTHQSVGHISGYAGGQADRGIPLGQAVPQRDPSPIEVAQRELEEATTELHNYLRNLEGRLSTVLQSMPNKETTAEQPPTANMVAARLRASVNSVRSAGGRIANMLDRLEL